MPKVLFDTKHCKGCFLCVSVCPTQAISPSGSLGELGYEVVKVDEDICIKCGTCYRICPDCVIEVLE